MIRSSSLVLALMVAALGIASERVRAAGSPDEQYAKVELKGELKPGKPAVTGRPSAPLLLANGLEFELRFGKTPPSAQELKGMYGKTVVATGTLENRRDPGGREHLVCLVKGPLKMADATKPIDEPEYLVGYKEGHADAAKELTQGLGLKVLEHYKPGQYLRVQPGAETKANFLTKLHDSDAIRFVERNSTLTIPGGEDRPTTPRQP
jgi:hypothetical protein